MPVPYQALHPAAFFDRDGVINVDQVCVHLADRLELTPGVARVPGGAVPGFVATDQSRIACGFFDETALDAFHAHLWAILAREGAVTDDLRYARTSPTPPFPPTGAPVSGASQSRA